jgi:hypothetical protein
VFFSSKAWDDSSSLLEDDNVERAKTLRGCYWVDPSQVVVTLEVDPIVEEEVNSVRCRGILYESEPGIEVKVEPHLQWFLGQNVMTGLAGGFIRKVVNTKEPMEGHPSYFPLTARASAALMDPILGSPLALITFGGHGSSWTTNGIPTMLTRSHPRVTDPLSSIEVTTDAGRLTRLGFLCRSEPQTEDHHHYYEQETCYCPFIPTQYFTKGEHWLWSTVTSLIGHNTPLLQLVSTPTARAITLKDFYYIDRLKYDLTRSPE